MKATTDREQLFSELEKWSERKDAFSVNEFLREMGMTFSEFDLIANGNKNFMKIWGAAEERAWENVKEALYTKSLPSSLIAEYIRESCLEGDPEEIMQSLETGKAKLDLYECAINGGDAAALIKCSFMKGVITEEEYKDFLEIDRMCSCSEDDE